MVARLLIKGAGVALRGLGKAIKSSKAAAKNKKRPKRKKRRARNDDIALPIALGLTGAASIGLSAKQGFDQLQKRKKSRTGGR